MIRLRLLGSLGLAYEDGSSVASVLAQPKRLALLAVMAATSPTVARSRDTLVALLWPEQDQDRARKSLRQALHALRRSLGADVITGSGDERVGVDASRLWCDAAAFSAALAAGNAEGALAVYAGPFLDGFHLSDAPELERWIERERWRLEREATDAARRLAGEAEQAGNRPGARRWAERALELAPYDEECFRGYLGVLERQADRAAAVTAFSAYAARLSADLGLEPSPETVALLERIRAGRPGPEAGPVDAVAISVRSVVVAPQPDATAPADAVLRARPEGLAPRGAWTEEPGPVDRVHGSMADDPRTRRRAHWHAAGAVAMLVVLAALGWRVLGAKRAAIVGSTPAASRASVGRSVQGAAGGRVEGAGGAGASIPARSIAVLPFENLSADPENGYFAAAIQDEILTDLAQVSGLAVISRESVMQYEARPAPVKEIRRQLGVANLLEGSVQREGRRIRISVQLIDARKDEHVWAATYDRELRDVFTVESEVARRIAEALEARLTPAVAKRLATPPTANPAAYQAYLRGLAFELGGELDAAHLEGAIEAYRRAVMLDSSFALALARYSEAQSLDYFLYDAASTRLSLAKRAAQRAVHLAPTEAEAHAAVGYYYYRGLHDYGRARTEFERAIELLPNGADEWAALAYIERRQGRWEEAVAHGRQALLLDPGDHFLLSEVSNTLAALRRFPAALRLLDRAMVASPGDPASVTDAAGIYAAVGDLARADAVLAGVRVPATSRFDFTKYVAQRFYARDYNAAIGILRGGLATAGLAREWPLGVGVLREQLAFAEQLAGQAKTARGDHARAAAALRARLVTEPDNPAAYAWLGRAEAGLGHSEAALAAGRRAVALLPARADALWGPGYEENLARIEAQLGDASDATATIRRLLAVPYSSPFANTGLTPALLREDPAWDPLRSDPGFRTLLRERR